MKSVVIALLVLLSLAAARADDIADAKLAFATLVKYQKTDDLRALELFTSSCTVVFGFTDGEASRTKVLKGDSFRESLRKEIAKKEGCEDVYENVKYTQQRSNVWVTGMIRYKDSGKRGPFSILYVRDEGALKIKHFKVAVPVNTVPPKATLL